MKITDINPFVRMASHISYNPSNRQGFPRDCRIIFITCGNADVIIENKHYNISKDSLVYIRSGLPYKICGQSKVQLYILNFDLTTNNSGQTTVMPVLFDKTVNVTSDHITDADFLNSHICISNGAKFRPEIDLITSEMADKQT
ncbi:MAG: hypothetical protein IKV89_01900, partial [Clostridia bacterium]|nr:hypothetical protein [Clostridia bacterium]